MAPTDNGWHLEQSWPGLVADRDGVESSPSKIEEVANAFRDKLRELLAAGQTPSPEMVEIGSSLEAFTKPLKTIKNWDGGVNFAATLMQGHQELTKVYDEVNEKLVLAIGLIYTGAGNYKQAEALNLSIAPKKDAGWQEI
ncbi:hypothetical protein ACIA8R_31045 [Nonomuraea sp. NPDC051191]|uniref:hypothetical protein n=1 Tax=Nonomuraea sp. NPDC051191 TaxID=3364372 RepID=UPI0037A95A0F